MNTQIVSIDDIKPVLYMINLFICEPGYTTHPRIMAYPYFLYIQRGKGVFEIDGTAWPTEEGDLFYVPQGVVNNIIADKEDPFVLSGIDFHFFDDGVPRTQAEPLPVGDFAEAKIRLRVRFSDFPGFPTRISLQSDIRMRSLIYEMIQIYTQQKRHWRPCANGLLQSFLIRVVQQVIQGQLGVNRRTDDILDYISEHFRESMAGEEMARRFHYNSDHLSRVVQACTGLTLHQYIIDLRIREAIMLLISTLMPIAEIASAVGYTDVHYFSRLFRQKTGYAPSHFRHNTVRVSPERAPIPKENLAVRFPKSDP